MPKGDEMTDTSSFAHATELWTRLCFPWVWLAPSQLSQPINQGWSFGNVIVNESNSSAPSTELAIVAEESYGRQIGKLLERSTSCPGRARERAAIRCSRRLPTSAPRSSG